MNSSLEQFVSTLRSTYPDALSAGGATQATENFLQIYRGSVISLAANPELYHRPAAAERLRLAGRSLLGMHNVLLPYPVRSGPEEWADAALQSEGAFEGPIDIHYTFGHPDYPVDGPIVWEGKPEYGEVSGVLVGAALVRNRFMLKMYRTGHSSTLASSLVANAISPADRSDADLHIQVLGVNQ